MSRYNLYRYITVTKVVNVDLCQVPTTGLKPQTHACSCEQRPLCVICSKVQSKSLDDNQIIQSRLNVWLCWDRPVFQWEWTLLLSPAVALKELFCISNTAYIRVQWYKHKLFTICNLGIPAETQHEQATVCIYCKNIYLTLIHILLLLYYFCCCKLLHNQLGPHISGVAIRVYFCNKHNRVWRVSRLVGDPFWLNILYDVTPWSLICHVLCKLEWL